MDFENKLFSFEQTLKPMIQKYCDIFDELFKIKVIAFSFEKVLKNNRFIFISNIPDILSIVIETKAYHRIPSIIKNENMFSEYCGFRTNIMDEENFHPRYFELLQKHHGINLIFYLIDRVNFPYDVFMWYFQGKKIDSAFIEEKNLIFQSLISNDRVIRTVLTSFRQELAPYLEEIEISPYKIEETQLFQKKSNYSILAKQKRIELLLKTHILTEQDLYLKTIILTKRERECVDRYLEGMTAKEIGRRLSISFRTVEQQLYDIKHKLRVKSKNQLYKVIQKINLIGG